MKKIETIWHYLLLHALNEGVFRHTQQDLAKRFHMSLSTVNHALRVPAAIGAIRKESKFFVLEDAIKLLYYWASVRSLRRKIFYLTYGEQSIGEIESLALPTSIFACYSAAKMILSEPPADYASVYFYDDPAQIKTIQTRFPPNTNNPPNIFFLTKSRDLEEVGGYATLPLTFVDIWNLPDWYAKDFMKALEETIHGLLSRSDHE